MPIHKLFLYASSHGLGKDIHVRLRLRNEWCFIATYPISICGKQEIRWHVQVSSNGEIQELEQRSINLQLPLPMAAPEVFGTGADAPQTNHFGEWIPNMPRLCNGNEMRRRRADFIEYIEGILKNIFQLDSRQVTDFVTSLLGTLLYEHVLFRFLSKDELQSAANLSLFPSPGLSIRIFLLYGRGDQSTVDSNSLQTTIGSATHNFSSTEDHCIGGGLNLTSRAESADSINPALHERQAADARETDWGPLVIGPRSANVVSDFGDPSLFKLVEYASFEVKG